MNALIAKNLAAFAEREQMKFAIRRSGFNRGEEKRSIPLRGNNAGRNVTHRSRCGGFAGKWKRKKELLLAASAALLPESRRVALASRDQSANPKRVYRAVSEWKRQDRLSFSSRRVSMLLERGNTSISFPLGIRRIYGQR